MRGCDLLCGRVRGRRGRWRGDDVTGTVTGGITSVIAAGDGVDEEEDDQDVIDKSYPAVGGLGDQVEGRDCIQQHGDDGQHDVNVADHPWSAAIHDEPSQKQRQTPKLLAKLRLSEPNYARLFVRMREVVPSDLLLKFIGSAFQNCVIPREGMGILFTQRRE